MKYHIGCVNKAGEVVAIGPEIHGYDGRPDDVKRQEQEDYKKGDLTKDDLKRHSLERGVEDGEAHDPFALALIDGDGHVIAPMSEMITPGVVEKKKKGRK